MSQVPKKCWGAHIGPLAVLETTGGAGFALHSSSIPDVALCKTRPDHGQSQTPPTLSTQSCVFFKPARAPGTPTTGRKWGPRPPQIWSDCPRKSLDFEIGVGSRLGTLRVSKSTRTAHVLITGRARPYVAIFVFVFGARAKPACASHGLGGDP